MLRTLSIAICGLLLSGCYVFDDWSVVVESSADAGRDVTSPPDAPVDLTDGSAPDQGVFDDGFSDDGFSDVPIVPADMPGPAVTLEPAHSWVYGASDQSVELTTLDVWAPQEWSVVLQDGVQEWVTVEPASGIGPQTITVTVDADPMPGREQTFEVTLLAGGEEVTSAVTFAYGVSAYSVPRVEGPLLDGACDEYNSEEIQLVTPKRQEVTRAWLGWDDNGIWLCADSSDIDLRTHESLEPGDPDQLVWYSDGLGIRIDPGRTRQTDTSYYFGVAVTGEQTESKGDRYYGRPWNQVWEAVTELHGQGVNDGEPDPDGWRAELHVPFSALDGHDPPVMGDRWVFNLQVYDRDDSGDNGGWPAGSDGEALSIGWGPHLVFDP